MSYHALLLDFGREQTAYDFAVLGCCGTVLRELQGARALLHDVRPRIREALQRSSHVAKFSMRKSTQLVRVVASNSAVGKNPFSPVSAPMISTARDRFE